MDPTVVVDFGAHFVRYGCTSSRALPRVARSAVLKSILRPPGGFARGDPNSSCFISEGAWVSSRASDDDSGPLLVAVGSGGHVNHAGALGGLVQRLGLPLHRNCTLLLTCADANAAEGLRAVVAHARHVGRVLFEPSASLALLAAGRSNGVVVDFGLHATRVALVRDGAQVSWAPLPVGGYDLTERMADVFGMPLEDAEALKVGGERVPDLDLLFAPAVGLVAAVEDALRQAPDVRCVLLVGGGAAVEGLVERLQHELEQRQLRVRVTVGSGPSAAGLEHGVSRQWGNFQSMRAWVGGKLRTVQSNFLLQEEEEEEQDDDGVPVDL